MHRGALTLVLVLVAACASESPLGMDATEGTDGDEPVDGGPTSPSSEVAREGGAPVLEASTDAGSPALIDETAIDRVAETLSIEFSECPLFTHSQVDAAADGGATDGGVEAEIAECATVELPLRWNEPDGETIELFVKRLAADEPARGQLWVLQGGPGSSGATLDWLAAELHESLPDLDIYLPDHRGVGRSTFFECESALEVFGFGENRVAECGREVMRRWGDATKEFSATAASRDVLAVATALHEENDEVFVWGGSYGAFWAHRMMQIDRGGMLTAVVLDSPALPIGGKSSLGSVHTSVEAGTNLFDECAVHEVCSERLGPAPQERALEIMDGLCDDFSSSRGGRLGMQRLLSLALRSWRLLRLIPAALYRAERCAVEDIAFLDAYVAQLPSGDRESIPQAPNSEALYLNVFHSEYVTVLTPWEEIERYSQSEVFSSAPWALDLRTALQDWPLYGGDGYMGHWAKTNIPTLVLYGGLDTATAPSEGAATARQFNGPEQQSYFFPTGGHGIYYRSHDLDSDPDTSCGKHVTLQFLRDPHSPVDASCIEDGEPLDFSADDELLLELAGHTDVWDNP